MSKYKTINLFDNLFITSAVFLIIYAWINFFIKNLIATFFLSLIFSFSVVFIIFYLYNKKKVKKEKAKNYLKEVDAKFLAFRLMGQNEQLTLLYNILKKEYSVRILSNSVIFKKGGKLHKIIIATNLELVGEFEYINLLQGIKNVDVLEIICNEFKPTLNSKILAQTTVKFITKKVLYDEYFSSFNIHPNCENLNTKTEPKRLKELAKNFFLPQRAKSYFFSGLILIFSSIILPYHFYYLIFGTALLFFSIICKLMPILKR